MTVYHINNGIGWASSGVEYAQAYRSKVLNELGVDSKFIFTDFFGNENLAHFTNNMGFLDEQVIWLYQHFTDIEISSTTYHLDTFEATLSDTLQVIEEHSNHRRYQDQASHISVLAHFKKDSNNIVQRVEVFSNDVLIRRDHFSYVRVFSEHFASKDGKEKLYLRTFYNEDGSVAYEENCSGDKSTFRINNMILYSKEAFIGYFFDSLGLTSEDLIILDRSTGLAQALLNHKGAAKLACVIHAEHYNVNATDDDYILWNNFYDYEFSHADAFDAFIASTDQQNQTLSQQFKKYTKFSPNIQTIPVGSLKELKFPNENGRKPYSMITCSRLAGEKHIDWLVEATVKAHADNPEVTLDIYGSGGEQTKLQNLINEHKANDYIQLMGHHDLTDVYKNYELYLAGSPSEGFGLTLMEAIGSGLPIIGLDVPYGNQTFVSDGNNGYLIPRLTVDDGKVYAASFAEKILQFFANPDQLELAHQLSYKHAQDFLTDRLKDKWQDFLQEVMK